MLSRLAAGPRICPSCRFGLLHHRAFRASPRRIHIDDRFGGGPGRWVKTKPRQRSTPKGKVPEPIDPFLSAFAGVRSANEPARNPPAEETPTQDNAEVIKDAKDLLQAEKLSRKAKMDATMAAIDKWLAPLVMRKDNIFSSLEPEKIETKSSATIEKKDIVPKKSPVAEPDQPEKDLGERSAELVQSLRKLEGDSGLDQEGGASKVIKAQKSKKWALQNSDNGLPEDWEVEQDEDAIDEDLDMDDDGFRTDRGSDDSRIFKHALLHSETLNVDALGETIDALIINNPNKVRRTHRKPRVEPETKAIPGPAIRWQDQIRENPAEINPLEEGWDMLEAKRLSEDRAVTQEEFGKLMTYVMDGFTVRQLRDYFVRKEKDTIRATKQPEVDYPWITSMGNWEGGVDHHIEAMTPKQHLVHMILTNIWKVEIKEEMHAVGWVPVFIKPDVVKILSQPSSTILEDLKNDFLDLSNKEDVALDADASKIDIFTKKWAVPAIIARLDGLLKSMIVAKISASSVEASELQRDVLDELARATETNIRHLEKTGQLEVSWIPGERELKDNSYQANENAKEMLALETPADVVARLLKIKVDQAPAEESSIVSLLASDADQAHVAQTREKSSMSWRDRQRTWFRLYSAAYLTDTKPEAKEESLQFQVPAPTPKGAVHELSATFGHVLHLADGTGGSVKESKNRLRILSAVMPHPAALTELAEGLDQITQSTAIIVRFVAKNGNTPEVRLQLPVNPGQSSTSDTLPADATVSAVTPYYLQDVLLPRESVDLRFRGVTSEPLDVASQSALKDFYLASELTLDEGHLRTPTHTTITLPKNLVNQTPKSKASTLAVPYLFAGAEVHQVVETPWRNHTLRFTNIAAGEHGGSRQELSLRSLDTSSTEQLIKLAHEVAEGKHFSWNRGAELVRELPDDPFLIDEEAELANGLAQDVKTETVRERQT